MATINTDTLYSSGTYVDNDDFTIEEGAILTIDESTIDIRFVRCIDFGECLVKNTSTTIPMIVALGSTGGAQNLRFEGAGIFRVEGEFITLGTGTGVAGQVFSIPLAQGINGAGTQSCPELGGLWIDGTETLRDGSSVPKLAMQVDDGGYTNATDHEYYGNVFKQDTGANTVTFKRAVPSGQAVMMANVIFKTGASFSSSVLAWDFNSSGTAIMTRCHWSGDFNYTTNGSKQTTLESVAITTEVTNSFLAIQSQIQASSTKNIIVRTKNNTVFSLSNSAQAGTHKNIWLDADNTGSSNNLVTMGNTSGAKMEKVIVSNYSSGASTPDGANNRAAINCTSPDFVLKDFYCCVPMMPIFLGNGASDAVIDNVQFQYGSREDLSEDLNIFALRIAGAVSKALITNYHQVKTGPSFAYAQFLNFGPGSSGNVINGATVRSGASGSGNNRFDNILEDNGNRNRYNNIIVHGYTKDGSTRFGANSLGAEVSNLLFVDEQSETSTGPMVGASCRIEQVYLNSNSGTFNLGAEATSVDSLSVMGIRNTADGGTPEQVDGLFNLRISPTTDELNYYTVVLKTGVIQFSNTNLMYIQNSGDIVELESFVHNNVSSIVGDATILGNNFAITIKMRRPEGTYTSYVAMTQSAMQTAYASLPSNTLNRVQFKFRVEKTSAGLADALNGVYFPCTLTGASYPFFTDAAVTVTAPNLLQGSMTKLINVTKGTTLSIQAVGATPYSLSVQPGDEVDIGDTLKIQVTFQTGITAKRPLEAFAVVTTTGASFVDSQVELTTYSTLGGSGIDGSTVTEFNIDSGDIEIDANDLDGESTKQRLVARYYYLITTSAGIDLFFNAIILEDAGNALIDRSITSLLLDNIGSSQLLMTDNDFRLYTSDDSSWIKTPSTGGYGVVSSSGKVYNASIAEVTAIKATVDAYLDATISSRASQASVDALPSAVPSAIENADAVWAKTI
jgi:hypothetical protein